MTATDLDIFKTLFTLALGSAICVAIVLSGRRSQARTRELEKRRLQEAEAKRQELEKRRLQEAEAKRQELEKRRLQEAEAREAKRKADLEILRQAEAEKKAEYERKQREAEERKRRQAELEIQAALERRQHEEERRRQLRAAAERKAREELKQKEAAAQKKALEEREQQEAAAQKIALQERKKQEAAAERKAREDRWHLEAAERKRRAQEQQARREADAIRRAELEQRRKEEKRRRDQERLEKYEKRNPIPTLPVIAGRSVSCTGSGPHPEAYMRKTVVQNGGLLRKGRKWDRYQVVVVGRSDFDGAFLKQAAAMHEDYAIIYLSQECFVERAGKGTLYSGKPDPSSRSHPGLCYLTALDRSVLTTRIDETVNWIMLPPGEHPFETIYESFTKYGDSESLHSIDKDRLRFINSLSPARVVIGLNQFNRYIAFVFEKEGKAVLECPYTGNAIYIMEGDWRSLSRLSKAQLLNDHGHLVKRVIHKGGWETRLRGALGIAGS